MIRQRYQYDGASVAGGSSGVAATDPETLGSLELKVVDGWARDLVDGTVMVKDEWADDHHLELGDVVTVDAPAGVTFDVVLMAALRDNGLEVISVPTSQIVRFLVPSAVVGCLAAVLPARRAAHLDVLDVIATE